MKVNLQTENFLSMNDLTPKEIWELLQRAEEMKQTPQQTSLRGRTLALVFEKPSLRTRVSFEVAMYQMGGYTVYLGPTEVGLGTREPVSDIGRVLSRWVDGVACRTFSHGVITDMADSATIPIINALSDSEHPCQALADLLTIIEFKNPAHGVHVSFIGDGNNVASSLGLGAVAMGFTFRIASPEGYQLPESMVSRIQTIGETTGGEIYLSPDPVEMVQGADVVYTDVWASMGQESDTEIRRQAFTGYQVNETLLAHAKSDALFMHDMPIHYGQEVPPGFSEHRQSVVYDQAENRLHSLKALLEALLGN